MDSLDKERLIKEVCEAGYKISSIDDLMKISAKQKYLVRVLLRWLGHLSDESDKQFIVRCLGVRGFLGATESLIDEFYHAKNISYKWAIGNTLSIIQDKSSLPELLKIAQEKEHGIARQMIVSSLWHYENEEVQQVLLSLLNDDEVVGHAISALGNMRDRTIILQIRPFQTHGVPWVRKEARTALKKLEKR